MNASWIVWTVLAIWSVVGPLAVVWYYRLLGMEHVSERRKCVLMFLMGPISWISVLGEIGSCIFRRTPGDDHSTEDSYENDRILDPPVHLLVQKPELAIAEYLVGAFWHTIGQAEQGVIWYRKAASLNMVVAQLQLGNLYMLGDGIPIDYNQAAEWLKRAAKQGSRRAKCALGHLYELGLGVERNLEMARKLFEDGTQDGDPVSQGFLATMYHEGAHVGIEVPEPDYAKALFWARKGAEQGDVQSQCVLGFIFSNGQGVEENDEEAVDWVRKAAIQGYPFAQHQLASLLFHGRGVLQNREEALRWLHRAAKQGLRTAQRDLAGFYQTGEGVKKDLVEAYKLLLLSGVVEELQKPLADTLTAEEVAEAERRAAAFTPRSESDKKFWARE